MTHIELPHGCIEASALRSLAAALERLEKFHDNHQGRDIDRPCLWSLTIDNGTLIARLAAGGRTYKMAMHGHNWSFV